MSEILAIDYDYGAEDYAAYSIHLMRTRSVYRRQRFLSRIAMPIAFTTLGIVWIVIARHNDPGTELWPFSFYFAAIALYTLYVWLWYQAISKRRLVKILSMGRNRALFGPTRIELRDDVFWRTSPMSEGWVRWAGIESVEHDADHAYIAIGSSAAYVVPRRAFADQAGYECFIARATALWRNAQKTA